MSGAYLAQEDASLVVSVGPRACTDGHVSRSAAAVTLRHGPVLAAIGALCRAPAPNCLVASDSAGGSAAAAAEVRCAYCLRSVGSDARCAGCRPCWRARVGDFSRDLRAARPVGLVARHPPANYCVIVYSLLLFLRGATDTLSKH